jgi:putative cell wall-binding protein
MEKNASAKKTVAGRVLAALLAMLMVIAALPATAFARTNGDELDIVIAKIEEVITAEMNKGDGINPAVGYYKDGDKINYHKTSNPTMRGLVVKYSYYYRNEFSDGKVKSTAALKTAEMAYDDAAFSGIFKVTPAQDSVLTLANDGDTIKVETVAGYPTVDSKNALSTSYVSYLYSDKNNPIRVERAVPKYAQLVNSYYADIDNKTAQNKIIVYRDGNGDAYALTHVVNKDSVTIKSKKIPAPLTGAKVTVKGDSLLGVTSDMLWTIDGTYSDKTSTTGGYEIYFTKGGTKYYLQFDGKDHIGDWYGGQAVASTLALTSKPTIHNNWKLELSEKQNNFAEMYLYTQNTGALSVNGTNRYFKFSMDYDKTTNCFYGKYENEDAGRDVFPNILTEEGKIGIYELSDCYLVDFEVVKDPNKMVYSEGDSFDPTGMEVKFIYNDGSSFTVKYEDFDAYGINISNPNPYQRLDVNYNGYPVSVLVAGFVKGAYTKGTLTVKPAARIRYELVNELESGSQYVIVARVANWNTAYDAPWPFTTEGLGGQVGYVSTTGNLGTVKIGNVDYKDLHAGLAVSSKSVNSVLVRDFLKDYTTEADASTLTARPVFWSNNTLVNLPVDPDFSVTSDQYWTVIDNGSAKNGYSIVSSDGKYLVRAPYYDKNMAMPIGLVSKAGNSDLYKWNIPGVNGTVITSANGTNNSDPYYLFVGAEPTNPDYPAGAFNYELGSLHRKYFEQYFDNETKTYFPGSNSIQEYFGNFVFFKVIRETNEIASIKIKDQPNLMTYGDGDKLDLSGMSVEITYKYDAGTKTVQYSDFAANGITVSGLTQDQKLSRSDNGKKITVTLAGKTATTNAITVLAADDNTYSLAKAISDGEYIIVFSNDFVAEDTIYDTKVNRALSSNVKKFNWYDNTTKTTTNQRITSNVAKDVTIENDKITSKVTQDMIWTIKSVYDKDGKFLYYTIKSHDGKYLTISGAYDDWALYNYEAALEQLNSVSDYRGHWQISGAKDADVYVVYPKSEHPIQNATIARPNNLNQIYLTVEGYNAHDYFLGDASDYAYLKSINFYTVAKPHTIQSIVVKTEPEAKYLTAEEGDKFESFGSLVVTITYKDGTKEDVKAADFAAKGITTDIKIGDVLTIANNGKPIKITFSGMSVDTATKFNIKAVTTAAKRLAGADRIATAVEIAKAGWTETEFVILANSNNYPDSLVGVPLAKAKDAPILLTPTGSLDSRTADEIKALKAKKVIILGGTAAVSQAVEDAVKALGVTVSRLGGATRYETAILIANEVNPNPSEIFLVTGKDGSYPDALSIGSVAAIKNVPILYVGVGNDINNSVVNYLNTKKTGTKSTCIIGGTAAVSADIQNKLAAMGFTVDRVDGADRYATSINVAKKYADLFKSKDIAIATGSNYPDALAGGAFAAKKSIPVILVNDGAANADLKAYIASHYATNLYVFGGNAVVSEATVNALLSK